MLGIESKNFINSPLVRPDFDGILHRLSTSEYLQVYQEFFYIYPPVKVMADFPALQDKTGTPDLKRCLHACMAASVYVKSSYKLHVDLLYNNCFSLDTLYCCHIYPNLTI